MAQSARDFMARRAVGKFISWDSRAIGDCVGGIIVSEPTMQQVTDAQSNQPKYFPVDDNGNREPMMQMLIEIDTKDPDPALAGDDGKRILAIRGGFKYESSKKALSDALKAQEMDFVEVGDYVELTRIPNVKAAGTKGRTHQFTARYIQAKNFATEMDADTLALFTEGDEAQAAPAPAKRGRPKKVVAPASTEASWEDD